MNAIPVAAETCATAVSTRRWPLAGGVPYVTYGMARHESQVTGSLLVPAWTRLNL